MTTEPTHRTVATNGARMHLTEAGAGPLVLLCHGFPELGYSWRHQLPALAEAGGRVSDNFSIWWPEKQGVGSARPDQDHGSAL
jgi:pimeloyl-ACP methyl ester carboxylesterase